jgi:hypothetical protein
MFSTAPGMKKLVAPPTTHHQKPEEHRPSGRTPIPTND